MPTTLSASAFDESKTIPLIPRKVVRLSVGHFRPPVAFTWASAPTRKYYVYQIGELGAGIQLGDPIGERDHTLKIGTERFGQLFIGNVQIPVRCRVLYMGKSIAGVQFIQPPDSTRIAIRSHFFLEHTAATLSPVHSYGHRDQGSYHRMTYTDSMNFNIELMIIEDRLTHISVHLLEDNGLFRWDANAPAIVHWSSDRSQGAEDMQRLFHGLFRNLRGLNPNMRKSLDIVLGRMKLN